MCAHRSDSKPSGTAEDRHFASCSLNGTEAIVAGLFKVVLNRPELHLDENLFALGINSLQAIELIARLNHTFDRRLSKTELFEHPTARAMAALLQMASSETGDAILTRAKAGEPRDA